MEIKDIANLIESILFVAGNAVETDYICEKLNLNKDELKSAIQILSERFSENNGINLLQFNGKIQFCSNPKNINPVADVLNPIREKELSKAMLEALAIIAYKQPVTKNEIEELRGVDSNYALQTLLKLNLIFVSGRKDAIGKPLLFSTTDEFLKRFSISSLKELPDYHKLMERIDNLTNALNDDKSLFDFNDYSNVVDVSKEENDNQNIDTELIESGAMVDDGNENPNSIGDKASKKDNKNADSKISEKISIIDGESKHHNPNDYNKSKKDKQNADNEITENVSMANIEAEFHHSIDNTDSEKDNKNADSKIIENAKNDDFITVYDENGEETDEIPDFLLGEDYDIISQ